MVLKSQTLLLPTQNSPQHSDLEEDIVQCPMSVEDLDKQLEESLVVGNHGNHVV